MALELQCPAFELEGRIPPVYTEDGDDHSPALRWSPGPEETAAYALVVDDPDAPKGLFTHWLLYDLPPDTTELAEGVSREEHYYGKGTQGTNSFGNLGYDGPAPPAGKPHRYVFHLYALRAPLGLPEGADRQAVDQALEGKVLAEATWVGLYGR